MIDVEERLRRGLDAAADTQGVPPGFDDRVARRVTVVRRRRVLGRGALVALVLAVIVGGVAAFRPDSSTQTTVAGGPATGVTTAPGWHPMADAPIPRRFQALSIAMGDRVLVWGGSAHEATQIDGAVYDADHNTWTKVPASPLFSGDGVGAWTGRDAIVLSGQSGVVVAAAYNPDTNSWRKLATPPLANGASAANHAVWTGTELVVVGVANQGDLVGTVHQVAIYDPADDSWRTGSRPAGPLPIFGDAVWTGSEVAVVGNVGTSGKSAGQDSMQLYNPVTDQWREIPWGLDGVRGNLVVAWTGSRLFVGGGRNGHRDAALVDLATGAWDRVPDAPIAFEGNDRYAELWTGTAVLTMNGADNRPVTFDPGTRTWQLGPASPAGVRRDEVSWAWVASPRAAVIWSGGLSSNEGQGITGCCTPIDGGETYTP
jgi:hypothetical protein